MRTRRTLLAGIAACATALAAPAAASADTTVTQTYTTPGLTTVPLPAGVTSVHVVAVGARGGGVQGGYGAVVTANLSNVTASGPANQIRVFVGGNGAIGAAGANGGGTTALGSLAGGGGGWSGASPCTVMSGGACALFVRELVAGGGGGAGADGLPGTGGAGGSAGATGGSGSATGLFTAAVGGSVGSGGDGGSSSDSNCVAGDPGGDPTTGLATTGGTGGVSASLDGHGDGGGGGGGSPANGSGGGGGAGAWCNDNTGASGAGGGGGASVVPAGALLGLDTTGVPSVTLTYAQEQPSVTISAPADGAVYPQGSTVGASFACAPSSASFPITTCDAPVATGDAIDTAALGPHTFTVSATDSIGMTADMTVQYRVTDQTPPRISGLRIVPRSIQAKRHGAHATVRFKLSEPASVRVTISPVRHKKGHAGRPITLFVSGHAGSNGFKLGARIGRRTLAAGTYSLTLVAKDPSGNQSRAAKARFKIVA